MAYQDGKVERATLALTFSIAGMLFSAGTMFFYYDLSKLKAEEVRQTVGSRRLLTDEIRRQTEAVDRQTEAIKELSATAKALRKVLEK